MRTHVCAHCRKPIKFGLLCPDDYNRLTWPMQSQLMRTYGKLQRHTGSAEVREQLRLAHVAARDAALKSLVN